MSTLYDVVVAKAGRSPVSGVLGVDSCLGTLAEVDFAGEQPSRSRGPGLLAITSTVANQMQILVKKKGN